ncbi:DNA ligase D [Terracidiphilus gabretensis]|uniref:DNA ligase D n=1 Tax=Terracidiphilus gabretensis TaxID=1577687 RepID=UPI00071B7408|nr:DNA ligase D [Terracidiphilus gabretensis]
MAIRKKDLSDSAKPAVKRQLAKYRAKRDFQLTSEPTGNPEKKESDRKRKGLAFVIQKHTATRLHYDFRLEWKGVLKSWAVAKGPSYNPKDKRLAIQVEDHPLEYGGFEGIIPKGQYGGGTVMVWDRGTWEPLGDAAAGFRYGNLKFVLHGEKLRGHWVLVRMAGKFANQPKPSWLLIKERDGDELEQSDVSITDAAPNSVLSGREMDAIAKAKDAVWNSKAADHSHLETKPVAKQGKPSSAKLFSGMKAQIAHLPKESLPPFVPPQLASMATSSSGGEEWAHELKLDGYRIQARVDHGARKPVQLLTRTALNWTTRLRPIAEAVDALPVHSALFDGEVVVLDDNGTSSFAKLQAAFQEGAPYSLTYFIFDLLHVDGRNLRNLPLLERKEILEQIISGLPPESSIRISEHISGDGKIIFDKACGLGAEGIISKLAKGKYVSGLSNSWLKLKCYREQELVIGGYTLPSNGTHGIGALLLGYYKDKKLIYAGRTGTGFTQKTHRMMRDRLESIRSKASSFVEVPAGMTRGVHWVRPELVAQIAFANWTADNLVRQAAFKGLREDKPAKSVQREEEGQVLPKDANTKAKPRPARSKAPNTSKASANRGSSDLSAIRLTHPDKVLDSASGLTKDELAHYYAAVGPHMLPHIAGRPLSLVRCMSGTSKPCFFQKHANETLPKDIESVDITDKKTGKAEPYITLSTAQALIELAQLSVLEIHSWGSKNDSIERPDLIVIDLDPDEAIDWKTLASAAVEVHERMKSAGLESFLKTTGGKGLHVVAPIRPEHDWASVKDFAHRMVIAMETDNASLFLTRMTKAARKNKIFLDYLRNDRGATAIAPYSPRARNEAHVALPLHWSELKSRERPVFLVTNFSKWQKRLNDDPWEGMLKTTARLKL